MVHKNKYFIPSNLADIRTALDLTQKQMGEYLNVSERMIQNYESNNIDIATTLPIDKALYICNKWGYSLDQIYIDINKPNAYDYKFTVDIRDFLCLQGENIIFSLPKYYWNYLKEYENIMISDILSSEKNRLIRELNSKYNCDTNNVLWKFTIPVHNFCSMLNLGDKDIPYASEDKFITEYMPTDEQIKEVSDFLLELEKGDHE